MDLYDLDDVKRSFSELILSRGRQYLQARRVLHAWIDEDGDIAGLVDGTEIEPYLVGISVEQHSRHKKLSTGCTCPYDGHCKHAAAVALYALENELPFGPGDDEDESDETQATNPYHLRHTPKLDLEVPVPMELREWINSVKTAVSTNDVVDPTAKFRMFYRLNRRTSRSGARVLTVTPVQRSFLKAGGYGTPTEVKESSLQSHQTPKHWTALDVTLIKDLAVNAPKFEFRGSEFRLDGRHGVRLLRDILLSGRCEWENGALLTVGGPRTGKLEWVDDSKSGSLSPVIKVEQGGFAVATAEPWFVDVDEAVCGPLDCGLPAGLASALSRQDKISAEYLPKARAEFELLGLSTDLLPPLTRQVVVRAPVPTACFGVDFEVCQSKHNFYTSEPTKAPVAFGKLTFEYEGTRANVEGSDVRISTPEGLVILKRDRVAEEHARDLIVKAGWQDSSYSGWEIPHGRGRQMYMAPRDHKRIIEAVERVRRFVEVDVPLLREAGWKVDVSENIRFIPDEEVEWDVHVDSPSGIDWFEFRLGLRIAGEPFDLKKLLYTIFAEQQRLGALAPSASEDVVVVSKGGGIVKISRKRLTAILQPLVEIFGGVPEWPSDLRLPRAMAGALQQVEESSASADITWKTTDDLRVLSQKLTAFDRLEPVAAPDGFAGELRGYQQMGLAWLQFLRKYGFAGVLADDMGLGKTVQIIAHIQSEKVAGRLDRPCLIVAPTSTMPNWRRECERFAPGLKVITLHGASRAGKFENLSGADIALTTYPLLARDKAALTKSNYHLLVLDEAQNIKNPVTAAAKAARELDARHRICLSGTPVENHLGELWSLFHFLMPGYLGTDADFKKKFRGPIEKLADGAAREALARRIRPFMLRRTKSEVVKELPPKTEIVESIEFDDPQRDLYESIRVAMDKQVQDLLASQGFEKSRIQILDALLKLRQVCCDPRLVKLPSAKDITASAKLDRLIEMLKVLVEDGRRVLVFSQFTSMLDLVEVRLREESLGWVRISGDTVDRETPVTRFQAGEVPIFLISLKAGGTGLNLTAADTVILYDPWWNPAVENQAIDRAHRIGQQKAVIVYKMVATGTIEEKMLEMQARKGDIAKSILSDDAEGIRTLTSEDLRWVLSRD